jgi:hypothetical protein
MIMRKIHKDYPVQVFEFSPIHFRIIGKISIDYWPSTGRAWITGSNDYAVKLEPESVFGFAAIGFEFETFPEGAKEHLESL